MPDVFKYMVLSKVEPLRVALEDVQRGLRRVRLAELLARFDIKQRYRRSFLGPFWITISTSTLITCLGYIFSNILKSNTAEFFPFVTSGLILWHFISSTMVDATNVFISSQRLIRQFSFPLFFYVERVIIRNFYIFLHNIIILPIVCISVGKHFNHNVFFFILGFLLLIFNLVWMTLVVGLFCTRFRDMRQIIISSLQVAFYATPIIWMPSFIKSEKMFSILIINPFYHLIEIVRAPLMGSTPSTLNWVVVVCFFAIGLFSTLMILGKYRNRLVYWL